jgi:hypothetical protein
MSISRGNGSGRMRGEVPVQNVAMMPNGGGFGTTICRVIPYASGVGRHRRR